MNIGYTYILIYVYLHMKIIASVLKKVLLVLMVNLKKKRKVFLFTLDDAICVFPLE